MPDMRIVLIIIGIVIGCLGGYRIGQPTPDLNDLVAPKQETDLTLWIVGGGCAGAISAFFFPIPPKKR